MKKKLDIISIWLARAVHNMDFRTAEAFVANRLHTEKVVSEEKENIQDGACRSNNEDMEFMSVEKSFA